MKNNYLNKFELNCIRNEELKQNLLSLVEKLEDMNVKKLENQLEWYSQLKDRTEVGTDLYLCYKLYTRAIESAIEEKNKISY